MLLATQALVATEVKAENRTCHIAEATEPTVNLANREGVVTKAPPGLRDSQATTS